MNGQPSKLPGILGPDGHAGMATETLDRIEADLTGVERALTGLDDATYGTCSHCHVVLDEEVLSADPFAARCPDHR